MRLRGDDCDGNRVDEQSSNLKIAMKHMYESGGSENGDE